MIKKKVSHINGTEKVLNNIYIIHGLFLVKLPTKQSLSVSIPIGDSLVVHQVYRGVY